MNKNILKIVDLFCGCSGFGLGAGNAGMDVALSIDIDPVLTSSHHRNFPSGSLLLSDVASLTGQTIRDHVGAEISGIIGGPPCQGFSSMGKSDPLDPRRSLLHHFFRVVGEVEPDFFVMENVRGLISKKNRPELDAAIHTVSGQYDIVGPMVLNAMDFGAATNRPRVFVVGFKRGMGTDFMSALHQLRAPPTSVSDAIEDLRVGKKMVELHDGFDRWSIASSASISAYADIMRTHDSMTSGLKDIVHKPEVAARFGQVPAGRYDIVGRHYRLTLDGQCPTLRAGTGPDKGSFQSVRPLHPVEARVINVREAARLQGFPDWFDFHPTSWHSFRMIGNSVSPILARAVCTAIMRAL